MQDVDSILRLIESMEKAGVNINDNGAIHSAADYFDQIAKRKEENKYNSGTVFGDVHMQYGIKMDIELLKEKIEQAERNSNQPMFISGLKFSLYVIEKQLNEFPWY